MQFRKHGHYQVETKDQVVITHMQGGWNKEAVELYAKAVKDAAQPFMSSPWVRIIDAEKFEGGGQEVSEALSALQQWSKQHLCIYVVFVLPQALVKYMLSRVDQIYQPYCFANSIEEALVIAQQQIAKA